MQINGGDCSTARAQDGIEQKRSSVCCSGAHRPSVRSELPARCGDSHSAMLLFVGQRHRLRMTKPPKQMRVTARFDPTNLTWLKTMTHGASLNATFSSGAALSIRYRVMQAPATT